MTETATDPITPNPLEAKTLGVMSGRDFSLYAMMIIVWGTSWIAMANQIDIVPALITGIYRFSIASLIVFIWAMIGRYRLLFPLPVHLRMALLGMCMFSTNFVMFYYAAGYMASGLMAIIFSLTSLINIVLSAIFLGQRPTRFGLMGAALGLIGIGLIFWPEIAANAGNDGVLIGLGFGLAGTFCFCTGNIISVANRKYNVPLVSANAWSMFYGTLWLLFLSQLLDVPFLVDWQPKYWIAMAWLVLMASVIAFWGYMTLLNNIGPARAGYLTVLFPIVALVLSTIFENYHWTLPGLLGLVAIIAGNILVMQKGKGARV
ncbi:DMT family transporter [uncultured Cohaesibacter sp.]|uniref:DMT family transporter n=1 Tax=uncultured Cohaesibacter sp. TaxID=1002546 RepID=UPI00292E59BD|nr:DMT family transporter [uncultured Cohaesibacter sp.]